MFTKMKVVSLLVFIFVFFVNVFAFSAKKKDSAVTEQLKNDKGKVVANINWTESIVTAKGVGVPMANAKSPAQGKATARRAAVVDAQRNLLEIIKGVRVSSETVVKDLMVESDTIKTSVEGIVKGANVGIVKILGAIFGVPACALHADRRWLATAFTKRK